MNCFHNKFRTISRVRNILLCISNKGKRNENKGNIVEIYTVTEAFDDVGITDMYIGDMIWAISGYTIISSDFFI
jgi:hypothetical protein